MNKKNILLSCTLFLFAILSHAYEKRNILQKATDKIPIEDVLIMNQDWVPYPDYTDRNGWNAFLNDQKGCVISQAEKFLNFKWQMVKATDYLEYERSGNRRIMEDPLGANTNALSALVIGELAEGKGRFMNDIINGVFHLCDMSSWVLSAHLASYQKTHRALPDHREVIMDLTSGGVAQMLSWTYYFLHSEFDKIDPIISLRLRTELQARELSPFLERDDYWWMALHYKDGIMVNNWCPWCNANALLCYFLLEEDKATLAKAVRRSIESVDHFLNYIKTDGACEEGSSYWGHAAGKLYDYLQILNLGTGGKISLFHLPLVKSMGEYIVKSNIGNGWVVNFADASAKGDANIALIYRYGVAVESDLMKGYAADVNRNKEFCPSIVGLDMFRTFETLRYTPKLRAETATCEMPKWTWYPETQFCYMAHKNGFYVAAKGGFNNESHNHNDVGTFLLYYEMTPILIDAGVGTYTKQTFSSERYNIWTMQSNYHNLPMINGVAQSFGTKYEATEVKANARTMSFSANIATAYPEEAKVDKWIRSYHLDKQGLLIKDAFSLKEIQGTNVINFLTWGDVNLSNDGKVIIQVQDKKVYLSYDAKMFDAAKETIHLTDPRLSDVWGNEIYRLVFKAKHKQLSNIYSFKVSPVNK